MRRLMLVSLLLAMPLAHAQTASKGTVYCCTDNGHQVCGDVLPPQCFGKSYREMSPQGTVRRTVEAPLSPEQLARREAEERARRAEVARQRAEMRRNQSLLETYSSVADIDSRRDRAIESVELELRQAEARHAQLMKKRTGLLREAEFFQKRAMPPALAASLRESDSELAAQNSIMEAKRRDIEAIRNRFEQDRSRYIALTEPRTFPR
ncbi:hypothetical protein [Zoogloea sp.]|jgi:hypothetical protein|uniref:hypothetical protein n=1 Tax=Zoogloea sp. TaxID=49181 RepID=UPI001D494D40|nr:hypothetical protein [Zoogloea sp.]MBK6655616.1 hypothetical protein [Zoogloea sp.]MBK7846887.1 hypothetical protein [Zoogloea sp.]HPI59238.1 hypothetical protein [Zoogloea sp.]